MRILTILILFIPGMCFCEDVFTENEYPDFSLFPFELAEIYMAKIFTFGSVDGNNKSLMQSDFFVLQNAVAHYGKLDLLFYASFLAGYQRVVPFYRYTSGIENGSEYNSYFYENDKMLLGGILRLEHRLRRSEFQLYAEYSLLVPLYSENSKKIFYNNTFLGQSISENYTPLHSVGIGFHGRIARYVLPENDTGVDTYIGNFLLGRPPVFNIGLVYFFSATQQSLGVYCSIGIFFPE